MALFSDGEQTFLRTIRDATEDEDGPHLVYADYLEEHGDCDRAELFRVHVAYTRLRHGHPDKDVLGCRFRDLLYAHGSRWLMSLPKINNVRWEFDRGVPGRAVVFDGPQLRKEVSRLFAETLAYQLAVRGTLSGAERDSACLELIQCAELSRLQALRFQHSLWIRSEEKAARVAQSVGFQSVRRI